MEFRLLGQFEAGHDGRPVATCLRRQERCLLGILLLSADRPVSTDRLIDLLWDGHPPQRARSTVQTYVGRLRRTLRPHGVRIVTQGDGYLVESGHHRVDAAVFDSLVLAAAATTDPADRVGKLDSALALWRGPLLAGTGTDRLRERIGRRLADARMAAVERVAEARLSMGLADRVAADLEPFADGHPERERLVGLLMTALYRCGRRAEALLRYRATRDALAAGYGAEPGSELHELYQRIKRADPRLDRPPEPVYQVLVRGHWLPWNTSGHPALEFCNTYAGWGGPRRPGSEWLRGYPTLAVWAGHLDLVDGATVSRLLRAAERDPLAAAAVLDQARDLRAKLYTCLTAPRDTAAFAAVADYVEAATRVSRFVLSDDGLGRWSFAACAGLRLPVHAVARCAAELLTDPRRFTLRACPSPECGWLFLDASGRRRWCSIATCGATASAGTHRTCTVTVTNHRSPSRTVAEPTGTET